MVGTVTIIDFSLPTHLANIFSPASLVRVARLGNAWDIPECYPRRARPHLRSHQISRVLISRVDGGQSFRVLVIDFWFLSTNLRNELICSLPEGSCAQDEGGSQITLCCTGVFEGCRCRNNGGNLWPGKRERRTLSKTPPPTLTQLK